MASAPVAASATTSSSAGSNTNYLAPLSVLTSLFFMWGFLTCLNDFLIPHLKAVFELSYAKAMMVQFAFFMAYFVLSIPSGFVVKKLGYKTGIIVGLVVAALGCVLFYPSASARSYAMFLMALFVLASGIVLLQVAANPFVALLGKPETASSRLTMTQAFNSLGTTLAPFFGSAFILSQAVKGSAEMAQMSPAAVDAYKLSEATAVQHPYLGLAGALGLLALAIAAFKLPKVVDGAVDGAAAPSAGPTDAGARSAWSYRHLVLGAVAIFVYVGGEVAIGSFLVNYFKEPEIGGLAEASGGKLVFLYWGGAMVGRFIGTFTLRIWKPGKVLVFHALGVIALVAISMLTTGATARYTILAVGLFNSIMFPTIFTLAIDRLGKFTDQGSGILCTAIVGGALIPVLQGFVADSIGVHHCFIVAALCYLYIAWYGAKGSVPVAPKSAA
jgi:FHS family L-fucose permease-like MFS transporter